MSLTHSIFLTIFVISFFIFIVVATMKWVLVLVQKNVINVLKYCTNSFEKSTGKLIGELDLSISSAVSRSTDVSYDVSKEYKIINRKPVVFYGYASFEKPKNKKGIYFLGDVPDDSFSCIDFFIEREPEYICDKTVRSYIEFRKLRVELPPKHKFSNSFVTDRNSSSLFNSMVVRLVNETNELFEASYGRYVNSIVREFDVKGLALDTGKSFQMQIKFKKLLDMLYGETVTVVVEAVVVTIKDE